MPRYKIILEYNGMPYHGWQRTSTGPSIQSTLEEAVFRFCGEQTTVVGAGRTDAGVHALAQVAHVDLPKAYDPFTIVSALNFHLLTPGADEEDDWTRGVAITAAEQVADDFHARFSATARHYEYRILNRRSPTALHAGRVWHVAEELDAEAMQKAANVLLGHHDFTTFRDAHCQSKTALKTLDYLRVARAGDEIVVTTGARSFLHHQVRIMVGTLRLAGNGKWTEGDMRAALEAHDRRRGGQTAPSHGLCLMRVEY